MEMTNNRITFKGSEYKVEGYAYDGHGNIVTGFICRIDKPKENFTSVQEALDYLRRKPVENVVYSNCGDYFYVSSSDQLMRKVSVRWPAVPCSDLAPYMPLCIDPSEDKPKEKTDKEWIQEATSWMYESAARHVIEMVNAKIAEALKK